MNILLPLLTMALASAVLGGAAHAMQFDALYGIAAGLALGALASGAGRLTDFGKRAPEWLAVALLVLASVVVARQVLPPVMSDGSIDIERALPLLPAIAALYVLYMLLSRVNLAQRKLSVPGKLEALFSGPPLALSLIVSLSLATYLLVGVRYFQLNYAEFDFVAKKFLERGVIPPLTVLLFCWGLLLLANKAWTLSLEWRALRDKRDAERSTLMQTYYQMLSETGAAEPAAYFDLMWRKSADFYTIPRYINWAIPILGFIGTVLGISLAADGIQRLISSTRGLSQLSGQLGEAIAPLGIAFDTTLIALSLSVFLMLLQTMLQRWEDGMLANYENRIRSAPLNAL